MKNQITKKRFVLANSLLGKGLTIKFTNKKNVNVKSKLPSSKQFDVDKLPSLNVSGIKG